VIIRLSNVLGICVSIGTAVYEKAIGHPTSNSTIYNLLGRHDWRKLMPRPFHPDRDLEAQKDFKKKGFELR
jgi:Winged helix-turn helix